MQVTIYNNFLDIFLYRLLIPLITTILIEGILIFLITKKKKLLEYSIFVNLFTNPLMNLFLIYIQYKGLSADYLYVGPSVLSSNILIPFVIGEICVFVIESVLYLLIMDDKKYKAFIYSFVLNITTAIVGILVSII